MANYSTLKSGIQQVIKTNANNEITGAILQSSLVSMINSLGRGYQYMGIAIPTTNPGTPDERVFYIATQKGVYSNFNSANVANSEIVLFSWNGSWTKTVVATLEKNFFVGDNNNYHSVRFYNLKPGGKY